MWFFCCLFFIALEPPEVTSPQLNPSARGMQSNCTASSTSGILRWVGVKEKAIGPYRVCHSHIHLSEAYSRISSTEVYTCGDEQVQSRGSGGDSVSLWFSSSIFNGVPPLSPPPRLFCPFSRGGPLFIWPQIKSTPEGWIVDARKKGGGFLLTLL